MVGMEGGCAPVVLVWAALAEAERLREELRAYKGEIDTFTELARLGLGGVRTTPLTARVVATIAALGRVTPGGVAPRAAVARAIWGVEPGQAEYHCLHVQAGRARAFLARTGHGLDVQAGIGLRIVDGVAGQPSRATLNRVCADCGGVCSDGSARCWPCYEVRRTRKAGPRCEDCGADCSGRWAGTRRCRDCDKRRRTVAAAASRALAGVPLQRTCADCGAPVSRRATRCARCHRRRYWSAGPSAVARPPLARAVGQ